MAKKAVKRPPTMRELQARKREKVDVRHIKIQNISNQLVKIHLQPKLKENGKREDFYVGAEDINLHPNKMVEVREDRTWKSQLDRLQKKRKIKVFSKPSDS
jgi:hypothetical protein